MATIEIMGVADGLPRTGLVAGAGGDPAAARALVTALFPGRVGADVPPVDLRSAVHPEPGRAYAGVFGTTAVVCGDDLTELVDLSAALGALAGRTVVRLQVSSVTDSAALEILGPDGSTVREVMLVGEQGVVVDDGPRLDFERPFFAGERDPDGAYAVVNGPGMPFDAVDYGQEALRTLFGFAVDSRRPGDLDARHILLHGFAVDPVGDAAGGSVGDPGAGDIPDVAPDPVVTPAVSGGAAGRLDPAGGGPVRTGAPTVPVPDSGATPRRVGGSWWSRLLDRLFG